MGQTRYQSAGAVALVYTRHFRRNEQTMLTNEPQRTSFNRAAAGGAAEDGAAVAAKAAGELRGAYKAYRRAGVRAVVFDLSEPEHPDIIFPNAILTFPGSDLKGYLKGINASRHYAVGMPMFHDNRQGERDILAASLEKELDYTVIRDGIFEHDLSHYENLPGEKRLALEASGSLALDRIRRVVYCALSPRSDEALARQFGKKLGYRVVTYKTKNDLYHTDLNLVIGTEVAAACFEAMSGGRDSVRAEFKKLEDSGVAVFDFPAAIQDRFGLNLREVTDAQGGRHVFMSDTALAAFEKDRAGLKFLDTLKDRDTGIIHADLKTLEDCGGGSAACITQELHGDYFRSKKFQPQSYEELWQASDLSQI